MMIVTKGLEQTYMSGDKPLTVLKDIDLEIEAGDAVAIVGPSGSGKTTLLGLMAGLFFLSILLSLHWRRRWMTFTIVGLAALGGAVLLLLNVPSGPLETVRESPWVGRLGQVLDMDQRTSRVRILIWGGAADLVAPHEPLDFPDGSRDSLNFLRPLIGYGPESMHVAYNKFFPPELARLEKRNASPDRSHNETWDALVTTGIVGLIAAGAFGGNGLFGLFVEESRLLDFLRGFLAGVSGVLLGLSVVFNVAALLTIRKETKG